MNRNQPLLTIAMPVYNGHPYLATALNSLIEQSYGNVELLISDNASNDDTEVVCRAIAARHPHVSYRRNATNLGALRNFLSLLDQARGKYFMWAAHDDCWNPRCAELLVERLEENPTAVLAAPNVLHLDQDGALRSDPPDRAPLAASRQDNLKRFYHDHAASWIYGVYRTDWLRAHVDEIGQYPAWGGDAIWIADVVQRYDVVGSQDAFLFKRMRKSGYAPHNARMLVTFWSYMFWYLCRNAWRNGQTRTARLRNVSMALRYVYRQCIRRPNVIRTAWRVTRVLLFASLQTIPWIIGRALKQKPQADAPAQITPDSSSRRAA
jgi:glycosyltransferase involved in cell wall biosynthesis